MITVSHAFIRALADNGMKGVGKRIKAEAVLERQQQLMQQFLDNKKKKR